MKNNLLINITNAVVELFILTLSIAFHKVILRE